MKKNYILLAMAFIGLNVSAQTLTTVYESDFTSLNNGQNILLEKEGETLVWTGANQIWQNFVKREGGLQTQSNWRGAHLNGKPVGEWLAGKSVQITTEVVITDASIFDESFDIGGSTARDLMFGITERMDHDSGNPDRGDAPSYGGAVSIGFELRDISETEGEMQVRLANEIDKSFVIANLADNDVIKFEYLVTKLNDADSFSAKLVITRNNIEVSTLESTFTQAIIYNAAANNTVFTAYTKIPYNAGGISNGTDEDHGLLWSSVKLEKGDTPTSILPETKDEVKVYCSNGVLFINNVSNEVSAYKIYDIQGAIVKEGTLASNKIQIPLTLNKGIYLVRVGNTTTKIIL